ncbi:MAG TPA: DUF1992 domain-containing protein [Candidatus Saccharimonadales bacterium]|nr:DUF1992 domain-containing protein [Candidatus Saccharimonadales bacterium]
MPDPREERLRELAERGELSGLPGEGRPLPLDGDLAGDRWAAFRVMQQNKILPPWAAARREIDARQDALTKRVAAHVAWLDARAAQLRTLPAERILDATRSTRLVDQRVRREVELAVEALNRRIGPYNAQVPSERLQLLPLRAEALFAAAAERRYGDHRGE